MNLQQYIKANNLPDFITTWEEVEEFTGQPLSPADKGQEKPEVIVTKVMTKLPAATPAPKQNGTPLLETLLAAAIAPYMERPTALIDTDAVIKLIELYAPKQDPAAIIELIKQYAPAKEIEIINGATITTVPGAQHEKFEDVLRMINAGLNLYLYGPAGTGKTQLAESAAQALNKSFYCISVCAQSTKSDLLGFIGANGNYIKTLFRDAYEMGGVFLIDEIDNGNPNVLAVLNAALANGYCAFPDGMIKRSPDFICIAAANTFGTGADRQYIGRNQLDAATLNRFVQTEINYDEKLECTLYGDIAKNVQKIRKALKGERVIISMRNIGNTAKLIAAGYSKNDALQLAVINTIPANLQNKI